MLNFFMDFIIIMIFIPLQDTQCSTYNVTKGMSEHIYHEYFVFLGMHGLTWTHKVRKKNDRKRKRERLSVNKQMRATRCVIVTTLKRHSVPYKRITWGATLPVMRAEGKGRLRGM